MTNFWQTKKLTELNNIEWEAVCDGCGKCCLHKLEDEDNNVFFTDVVCRYLDNETCSCGDYKNRQKLVKHCLKITHDWGAKFNWLPETCAYRLLSENKPLPQWHYLVSASKDSVHLAGASVRNRTYTDNTVAEKNFYKHIVDWV